MRIGARDGRQGLIQHEQRPKREDPATACDLLAVVIDCRQDGNFIVHPRGRRSNAFLKGGQVWNTFGVHGLRFGDLVIVSVVRDELGRDNVADLRGVSESEYENR